MRNKIMRNQAKRNNQTLAFVQAVDLSGACKDFTDPHIVKNGLQFQNALRILAAICLAPLGTIGLLLVMNALIDHDLPEPEPAPVIFTTGIFDIPKPEPEPEPRELEKLDEIELPPPTLRIAGIDDGDSIPIGPIDPVGNGGLDIRNGMFESDTPIRLVAVAPEYPVIALGKDGHVDVRFDITKAGTTENITIVAYEPSKIFNRSVLRAVSKWRYQPRLVQGEPVETKGVMERVSFKMEE